jgi:hypothetical protein
LTKFDISKNSLCAAGVKALAEGLKGNQVMAELNLAGNEMGKDSKNWDAKSDTSGVAALADVIPGMGAMSSLNLATNALGQDGASSICDALLGSRCAVCTFYAGRVQQLCVFWLI